MSSINGVISQAVLANLLYASSDIRASVLNLSGGVKTNANVADLAVGNILASQSNTLGIANLNAGQGKSLVGTAKSALERILTILQDQKALAVKANDDSLTDNDRANLNLQFQANVTEINRIATTTKFNNKVLLDGSASGVADLTTKTGQALENYTLLTTADFTTSGTTAAGYLSTSSAINAVATNSVGKTAGTAILDFGAVSGAITNAVVTIGANTVTFSTATATPTGAATAFVAAANIAAETLSNTDIRKFTYVVSGSTVLVTTADLGTAANTTNFSLTSRGGDGAATGITADAARFGGDNIDVTTNGAYIENINSGSVSSLTAGTVRTVAAGSITLDANLQGKITNFTATLDSSGSQNKVVFTADINGQTYTSQAIALFGTGGLDSQGAIIKAAQTITFYNPLDDVDADGEITNNAFTLTVGAADVTVSGTTSDAVQTSLTTIAESFETQLDANHINQSRSLIFDETNPTNADFTLTNAVDTIFEGIKGFDAVGTNAKGDINFIGDIFGTDGNNSTIGPFSYNVSTDTISTTINGEVYSSELSTNAATLSAITTQGLATGTGGSFNSSTNILTIGSTGTGLVFHSASNTDGKQLRIDLSNLTSKTSINLNSTETAAAFTDALDTLFGVSNNPSLSFQVGTDSDNTVAVALSNSQTSALYKDDAGAGKTLDISTEAGAAEASDVLDNAIDNALSRIATASSAASSFTSAIVTNNVMINNFDASSSILLNTDYAAESTIYAEATLRYNAAISTLTQEKSRMQGLLKLLQF